MVDNPLFSTPLLVDCPIKKKKKKKKMRLPLLQENLGQRNTRNISGHRVGAGICRGREPENKTNNLTILVREKKMHTTSFHPKLDDCIKEEKTLMS